MFHFKIPRCESNECELVWIKPIKKKRFFFSTDYVLGKFSFQQTQLELIGNSRALIHLKKKAKIKHSQTIKSRLEV